MTPERWQQVDQLLNEALELEPHQRAAFLDTACAGDEELRREVETLLAFTGQASGFAAAPPDDLAAEMLAAERKRTMAGRTLGHYQLRSMLGAGGMGQVYRARDLRLDRDVAVKILPEHLADNPEALCRFEREAKAVAALSHPNILAIFDFGTEEGVSYAVMELLEGETLRTRLARGSLSWREAVEIGIAIADGLAAAHAKGIIHRDLKPENIFLTADGVVKILDFGIARVKRTVTPDAETITSTTTPGTVMGTLGYMSPEQVRGETADAPSDVFSFGCVLYEMLSGQRPFARGTTAEMIAAILDAEPPALTGTGKKLPAGLERIIRHCLPKRERDRYQSARDLAFDLRAVLNESGQVISAPPLARRGVPRVVWLAASLLLLAAIALAVYLFALRERAIDSLAILPLINASGDAELEYLSDGISESLINALSQLPQLRVMARSTVFSYKGKKIDPRRVGQELNVRAIFTGRVEQRSDTLTIQADLVNAADGSLLWGERYVRKLTDLLAVQEEIARQISGKLRLRLTGTEQKRLAKRHTDDIEAHRLYLKGRYYWNKSDERGLKQAVELFRQAIDRDPNYALAYVGLADAYFFLSTQYLPAKEAIPRSRASAMKALELDESLGEAYAALAAVKVFHDWDWAESEQTFKRALEFNPNYASAHNQYGILLVLLGRYDEAQIAMNRARELDPLSPYIHVGTVWPVLFARRYDEAIVQLRQIIALNPDFVNAHINLMWAYGWKGAHEDAIAAARKAKSLDSNWVIAATLGYIYAQAGRHEEARRELAELQQRAQSEQVSEYGFAIIYAGLGQKDEAFTALEKAYAARDDHIPLLKAYPFFDSLRADPRFTDLLRRLKLAP